MIRDERHTPEGKIVREWDPDVGDVATVTVYDLAGRVVSTDQVDVSAERQATLADRARQARKADIAGVAVARLEQIRDADPRHLTSAHVLAAVQDIARYQALLIRDLYDVD